MRHSFSAFMAWSHFAKQALFKEHFDSFWWESCQVYLGYIHMENMKLKVTQIFINLRM
jgi:hypothetical protein